MQEWECILPSLLRRGFTLSKEREQVLSRYSIHSIHSTAEVVTPLRWALCKKQNKTKTPFAWFKRLLCLKKAPNFRRAIKRSRGAEARQEEDRFLWWGRQVREESIWRSEETGESAWLVQKSQLVFLYRGEGSNTHRLVPKLALNSGILPHCLAVSFRSERTPERVTTQNYRTIFVSIFKCLGKMPNGQMGPEKSWNRIQ